MKNLVKLATLTLGLGAVATFGVLALNPSAVAQTNNAPMQALLDRAAIQDTINTLFVGVDGKAWPQVRGVLADQVRIDFTSLNGGQPATVTGDQLVGAWTGGLHREKTSLHMTSNYRITVDGDRAEAFMHGYAWNRLVGGSVPAQGSPVWETWGNYVMAFQRTGGTWRITSLTYNSTRVDGNDAVRVHALQ